MPTEDDFVNKLVTDAENRYKYEKDMIKLLERYYTILVALKTQQSLTHGLMEENTSLL